MKHQSPSINHSFKSHKTKTHANQPTHTEIQCDAHKTEMNVEHEFEVSQLQLVYS